MKTSHSQQSTSNWKSLLKLYNLLYCIGYANYLLKFIQNVAFEICMLVLTIRLSHKSKFEIQYVVK